ncbi:hypothetical protein [Nostoc sp. UIC 10630]|uniref:hypothetical protein n=1 Tax=Nostoc sp. UIC 10630 TaxID=2100146 RepID=UPI0013D58506|nr:hypothetical protein [Nostoc sp. UIC 10630]NEU79532.1 hypothetical protein [Nostoc sp. UIC 10630]
MNSLNRLKEKAIIDQNLTVFVYYSGYGLLDKMTKRYYLLQHDIKPTKLASLDLAAGTFTDACGKLALNVF